MSFQKQAIAIKTLMEKEYYNNIHNNKYGCIKIPIKKIDNISVIVQLKFYKRFINLEITSVNVDYINDDGYNKEILFSNKLIFLSGNVNSPVSINSSLDNYVSALTELNRVLKTITFNRYKGKFIENTDDGLYNANMWDSIISNNIKIIKQYDNCCICLEPTLTLTKNCCKKHLCFYCWDKIELKICNECIENENTRYCDNACCFHKQCPLCRQSLVSGGKFPE